MKYAVIGAGPIGGSYGAYLAQAGQEVHLIDTNSAHVEAINSQGLHLDVATVRNGPYDKHLTVTSVTAHTDSSGIRPVDVVLVGVKDVFTQAILPTLRDICTPDTLILCTQNGMGTEDIIEDVFPGQTAYSVVQIGGRQAGPGLLACSVPDDVIQMGGHLLMTTAHPRFRSVLDRLCQEGNTIDAQPSDLRFTHMPKDQLDKLRWSKLTLNAVVNSIGAVTEGCMDSQQSRQSGVDYGEKIMAEACAVAQAEGVDLRREDIHLPSTVQPKKTSGYRHYTSMCMDAVAHRPTENDFIAGAILRAGRKHGIDTPYTQAVYWLIDLIEHTYEDRYTVYNQPQRT